MEKRVAAMALLISCIGADNGKAIGAITIGIKAEVLLKQKGR